MKNILKYTASAFIAVLALASCEEMEDYQKTIDAAPKLAYVHPKGGDTFSTLIVHRPTGSTGSFHTEFQPNCNTVDHGDVNVTIEYDASLVASYNEKHGTSYVALPEEYISLTNASVVIPADTTASRDTVKLDLNAEKDLAALTERTYLAPLKLVSADLQASSQMGNLWLVVNTETNLIRPIESADDMVGFTAGGTSEWTADCGNSANLFDGNNSTSVQFEEAADNVITVDMKKSMMVTGLKLNIYQLSSLSIEYSEDALEWKQAGTPLSSEYVYDGSSWSAGDLYVAVYNYFTARYIRVTLNMGSRYSSYWKINEFGVYVIESTEPTIYTTTGSDNVVSGKIVHVKGSASISKFSSSFKVYSTISSENGYEVKAGVDNSLVEAYNTKHGTSYAAMPVENVMIDNSSISIAAGENASAEEVTISLEGDLSKLTDENGYLVPVKLSASGAVTSESRGVVYAVIKTETKIIKPIESVDDILGFPASGRSSWTADCGDYAKLFDGDNSTSVRFANNPTTLTVNFGQVHLITGLHLYATGLRNVSVEYTSDGSKWQSAGTADDSDVICNGGSWSAGDFYMAFGEALEAKSMRVTFEFTGSSYYYWSMSEFDAYEIESLDPTIYTVTGTDNVVSGKIVHHEVAGSVASVNASFNPMSTDNSGYSVSASVDASLVDAFNSAHKTNYAALDASYVQIDGIPCEIAAGSNKSDGQITVSLTGDMSKLTNKNGYLVPVKLSADGAVTSTGRGVVYVAISVETSSAVFQSSFDVNTIAGTQVADRSGWKILECDEDGIYNGTYAELFDGDTETYVRTWGGPVSFTVDLGQEYDMTGLVITARTDSGYSRYQPTSMQIMTSLDGTAYTDLGTATSPEKNLVSVVPSSYVSLYGSKKVRYLKIEAGYGSNMGTSEFNIYVK